MHKRKCTFNEKLKSKFPYLSSTERDSEVTCSFCKIKFSIGHGGNADIIQHERTVKHKAALAAAASSSKMDSYFAKKNLGSDEAKMAAAEGTFAFHTVRHYQSYSSMDCTSKLIKKLYDAKFSCARTKCEAIVNEVLVPWAKELLFNDLSKVSFVTLSVDASNHKDIKLFPVLVRYFLPESGVHVKMLEFDSVAGETSTILTEHVLSVIEKHNFEKKLTCLSADNTNSMFGRVNRGGENNLFKKLQDRLNKPLVGIGCMAHIVHNSVESAVALLPVDVENIIVKIYKYLHIYTYIYRVERLKTFCDFVSLTYRQVLGYSSTRWLALMPALESFFLSESGCPVSLQTFFENKDSEVWLMFLHSQLTAFEVCIREIERQNVSFAESYSSYESLINKIQCRKDEAFISLPVKQVLRNLDMNEEEKARIMSYVHSFYEQASAYLISWGKQFKGSSSCRWSALSSPIEWNKVEASLADMNSIEIDHMALFDEVATIKDLIKAKIPVWRETKALAHDRWVEIFKEADEKGVLLPNLKKTVEYCMCLPGSNAGIERLFSKMNLFWSSGKTNMLEQNVGNALSLLYNLNFPCSEMYDKIVENKKLCREIHSRQKYGYAANTK